MSKINKEIKDMIDDAVEIMDEQIEDRSVPRNIRENISEAKEKTLHFEEDGVNFSTAIYVLDDISNDINMPHHTRTEIWNIISKLEAIKEKFK